MLWVPFFTFFTLLIFTNLNTKSHLYANYVKVFVLGPASSQFAMVEYYFYIRVLQDWMSFGIAYGSILTRPKLIWFGFPSLLSKLDLVLPSLFLLLYAFPQICKQLGYHPCTSTLPTSTLTLCVTEAKLQ